jgi:hypothetical protein
MNKYLWLTSVRRINGDEQVSWYLFNHLLQNKDIIRQMQRIFMVRAVLIFLRYIFFIENKISITSVSHRTSLQNGFDSKNHVHFYAHKLTKWIETRDTKSPALRFETISPAFRSGQSWKLKNFPLVPTLVFMLMIKFFWKFSFGTPLKNFLHLLLQKGLASLIENDNFIHMLFR